MNRRDHNEEAFIVDELGNEILKEEGSLEKLKMEIHSHVVVHEFMSSCQSNGNFDVFGYLVICKN